MLSFRVPTMADMELYFEWANDPQVREQSYNSNPISLKDHKNWFERVVNNKDYYLYVFMNTEKKNVGQVRIHKQNDKEAIIGISIAPDYRGKGYAKQMLHLSADIFLAENVGFLINAYIKETNLSSKISFEKAGFKFFDMIYYENFRSFHYLKR